LAGETIALDARLSVPDLAVLGAGPRAPWKPISHAEGPRNDPDVTLHARSGRIEAAGKVLERLAVNAVVQRTRLGADREPARHRRGRRAADLRDVRGQPDGRALQLEEGVAQLGPARLVVAGRLDTAGPVFDGTARLDATDLAPLGRLAGQAGLAGRLRLKRPFARAPNGEQGFDAKLDAPR
jgi:translocation and assembly module TamB